MRVTIDGAGRFVIPKAIRDRLALKGGETLEIEEHDGRIEMYRPGADTPLVRTASGRLVFADGPRHDAEDVRRLLEATRR